MNSISPVPRTFSAEELRRLLEPRYVFLEVAGQGHSSIVCKVKDTLARGEIKAVRISKLDEDGLTRKEAEEEFLFASRFSHPNLLHVYDLHLELADSFALVSMEWLPRANVKMGGGRKMPVPAAAALFVQLMRALQMLHEADYIHADVKPANIWCADDNGELRLKLLDYHLAYKKSETPENTTRGTLRYLSPEAIAGDPVDERSDLYSAGVVLYEMLSGRALFAGTPKEIARKQISASVPELALPEEFHGKVNGYIRRLLAKKPAARFSSAAEAAQELIRLLRMKCEVETLDTLLGRLNSVPVVGQEPQIRQATGFLARESGKSILIVDGARGAGKSRMLQECRKRAQVAGAWTILLEQPLTSEHIVNQLERALGLWTKAGRQSAASARSDSEIGAHTLGLSSQVVARLNGIVEGFRSLPPRLKPIIFCDDLQNASRDALPSIGFLQRTIQSPDVLWCLVWPGAAQDPVSESAAAIGLDGSAERVTLDELELAERQSLVRAAVPAGTSREVIDAVISRCGGSPSALLGVLEGLFRQGAFKRRADGRITVNWSKAVDDVSSFGVITLAQMKEVPARVRVALELLAIHGEELLISALAESVRISPDVLRSLMNRDELSGCISFRRTDAGDTVRFQNSGSIAFLTEHLPAARRAKLHDLLAEALSKSGEYSAWVIAHHLLRGGRPLRGVGMAVECLIRKEPCLPTALIPILDAALPIAKGVNRRLLAEARADAGAAVGEMKTAEEMYRSVLAGKGISIEDYCRLTRKVAELLLTQRRTTEAKSLLTAALAKEDEEEYSPHDLGELHLAMALACGGDLDRKGIIEHCDVALSLGEATGDSRLMNRALLLRGRQQFSTGDATAARRSLFDAFNQIRASADYEMLGELLAALGDAAILAGRTSLALRFYRRAERELKKYGRLKEVAWVQLALGSCHQRLYGWDDALTEYAEALRIYRVAKHREAEAAVLGNMSHVFYSCGRIEEAIKSAQDGLNLRVDNARIMCEIMIRLARSYFGLGQISEAAKLAEEICAISKENSFGVALESACRLFGEIKGFLGDTVASVKWFELANKALENPPGYKEAQGKALLAEALLAAGSIETAQAHSLDAVRIARESKNILILGQALFVRGRVLLAQGATDEALPVLLDASNLIAKTKIWDVMVEVSLALSQAYRRKNGLKFAAYHLRTALDTVDNVLARMKTESMRAVFMSDPRRLAIRKELQELKEAINKGGAVG